MLGIVLHVPFRTYFRTSTRTGMARGRPGIRMDRVIASILDMQPCQSLVTVGRRYR